MHFPGAVFSFWKSVTRLLGNNVMQQNANSEEIFSYILDLFGLIFQRHLIKVWMRTGIRIWGWLPNRELKIN
jgi:hypothetical protein